MDNSCRDLSIRGIQEGTQQGHDKDQPTPADAFRKSLSIPGEESHRPDYREVEKAAFHPPVDGGGRTGVLVCLIQDCRLSLYDRR